MDIEENRQWVVQSPKYLIGLAVVFWGVMVEHEIIGLALGLLLESHLFVKTRWKFGFRNFVKAWHMSVIFTLLAGLLYWMDGVRISQMRVVFEWMPLLLSPLIFVQRFGEADAVPLNTFSFMARYRMKSDITGGRVVRPIMINLGMPYFCITLLSAGLVRRRATFWDLFSVDVTMFYGVGVLILMGLFIYLVGRKMGRGMIRFIIVYGMMIVLGNYFLGHLVELEKKFRGQRVGDREAMELDETETRIGKLGELKQSKKIHWRMWVPEGEKTPELVPIAIFDMYRNGIWSADFAINRKPNNSYSGGVLRETDLGTVAVFGGEENGVAKFDKKNAFRFLSTLNSNRNYTSLPHVNGYFAVGGLVGELAQAVRSPLASLRLDNPESTLHCYVWKHKSEGFTMSRPRPQLDKWVVRNESHALEKVVVDLGLRNLSDEEKIDKLRWFFNTKFKYTTHLTIDNRGYENKKTAISQFLLFKKEGHCEYFATAAALLLRQAGVNTRYINGYAVSPEEKSNNAYLLRGDQAHAWCQAWINNKWVDVDLTPPDWTESDLAVAPSLQDRLSDWWRMWKEDFQVWRSDPLNAQLMNRATIVLICGMVLWIFVRLWFAKNRKRDLKGIRGELPPWKMIRKFDKWCARLLGPRPVGMAYGNWISQVGEEKPDKKELVEEFVEKYQRARFDEENEDLLGKLRSLVKDIMKKS